MPVAYNIPPVLLLVLVVGIAVFLACAGQIYVHRRFGGQDFVRHNEVGGFIVAVVGSLYAVVLGFLTVIAWQHFADARELVAAEAAAATDAWHSSVGLPLQERRRLRQDMKEYARIMVSSEWPEMRLGGFDKEADVALMDAIGVAGNTLPANLRESNAQSASGDQLGVLHDDRQRRLSMNSIGVSGFEWLVLLIGAACVIAFCWLFGLANARVHLLMTSAVTIVIASTLVLLFELQYPFRSPVGIGDDAWRGVLSHIDLMESGTQPEMRM